MMAYRRGMKSAALAGLLGLSLISLPARAAPGAPTPAWRGYAGDAQHSARAPATTQALSRIRWTMPVDLKPQLSGDTILIHYASPMITAANTVLVPVKTGPTDGFRIEARAGADGALIWRAKSAYVLPPHDWTPSFPAHLTAQNRLYFAGPGGTVRFRDDPDAATGAKGQLAFFGIGEYRANQAVYDAHVMVSTPITADEAGNIYFGFTVTGSTPAGLKSGVARIGADGKGRWVSAADAADDPGISGVPLNAAPAVSPDQKTIYVAVTNGSSGSLLALNSANLKTKHKAALTEPGSGSPASIFEDSSAAPTIGPDGDVYYGVLETSIDHHFRGWLIHYDATLATRKPTGSFGWDDTVSVVPASAVPSYEGTSAYLLMSKYNDYYGTGGAGKNRIAILDPNAEQKDRISGLPVMREVLTILSPHHVPGQPQGARYEWCINSAAVDPSRSSVFANAEDGQLYRWDLTTNTLAETMPLNAPRGEAYTPTLVGPDGTVYAINNATLYAVGE